MKLKKWIILVIWLGVLYGCKETKIPSYSGVIAFGSNRDGNQEIYRVDINGENLVRLTNNPARDMMPFWSPDGKKIAFVSDRDDGKYIQIYTMNADGTDQRPLTNSPLFKGPPSWSPNGKKIVFAAAIPGDDYEIYMIDDNGKNLVKLTDNKAEDGMASWSPDGTKIVFGSGYQGEDNIYIMDISSRNQSLLIKNGRHPCWSPDGKKILFKRSYKERSQIYLLDLDDSHRKEKLLTKSSKPIAFINSKPIFPVNFFPSWSPDGKYIVFTSDRHHLEGFDIYIMDAEGKNNHRLINHPAIDWMPAWRPRVK